MAKVATELGNQVYLWTTTAGVYAPKVIISAHGWRKANTGRWAVGASTLVFFVADGNTLDDIGSAQTVKGVPRTETVPNANTIDVIDYTLGKYIEHKSEIKKFAKKANMTFAEAERDMASFGVAETYATYRDMTDNRFDYVTIRNRAFGKGGATIKLSAVIELIRAQNAYTEYFCAFCREVKA